MGFAAVVRTGVAAVVGLLVWGFAIEHLLFAFLPSIARLATGEAQNALGGLKTRHPLPAASGGAVLILRTAGLAPTGLALSARRHV